MTSIIPGSSTSNRIFQGQRKDFIVMRKDTFEYTGTYTYINSSGTSVEYDFTGCIGMMHIKKRKIDTVPVKVIGISFDEYEYTLTADAEDMDLDAGKYFYDLQIYDANDKMVTKLYGNFIVLQDVTDFEGIMEPDFPIGLGSEIAYTFKDFIHQASIIAITSEIEYSMDMYQVHTITIFPDVEIAYGLFKFLVFSNPINIKSEVTYTFDDFIYFPMNISLQSEVGYLQQYYANMTVNIYSEIIYEIINL